MLLKEFIKLFKTAAIISLPFGYFSLLLTCVSVFWRSAQTHVLGDRSFSTAFNAMTGGILLVNSMRRAKLSRQPTNCTDVRSWYSYEDTSEYISTRKNQLMGQTRMGENERVRLVLVSNALTLDGDTKDFECAWVYARCLEKHHLSFLLQLVRLFSVKIIKKGSSHIFVNQTAN